MCHLLINNSFFFSNNGTIILVCFDRCSQELLCESGDQDECVANVGVSRKQLPLSIYCECHQDVKHTQHDVEPKAFAS